MINNHLAVKTLTAYIYRSIDDAQREVIDAHLAECQICRAQLSEQERWQRKIKNELDYKLKNISPPTEMNFAKISPQLNSKQTRFNLWPRLMAATPATLALIGILLAVFGLWQMIGDQTIRSSFPSYGTLPTLACFFLMLASVGQFDRYTGFSPRIILTWAATFLLWLGTALIGLLNLIVIRDLVIFAVLNLGGNHTSAAPIAIAAVMVGALCYIGVVVGSGEYHYRNIGQPGSWKLFSIILLVQLFIFIIPYLIG
jgi:hypothetical protein